MSEPYFGVITRGTSSKVSVHLEGPLADRFQDMFGFEFLEGMPIYRITVVVRYPSPGMPADFWVDVHHGVKTKAGVPSRSARITRVDLSGEQVHRFTQGVVDPTALSLGASR